MANHMTKETNVFLQNPLDFTGDLTATGWQLPDTLTRDQYEDAGRLLSKMEDSKQWWIGDWWNAGVKWGEGQAICDAVGLSYSTAKSAGSVSNVFKLCRRRHNLSYSHHVEVASVKVIASDSDGNLKLSDHPDHEKISDLLDQAETTKCSVVELRNHVREYKEWQRQHIAAANEPDKYAVIYADPPWQYNSGDQHSTEEQETVLGDHYPSMALRDICNLPQAKLAATDCVLFLWCTSPTLEEAFAVIKAWGFAYKASMVWDKVAHNVGHYVSVRHELLLIATRGQPPKVPKLVDSVYVEERGDHSRKPEYFLDLIDELYPDGKRIEFFCRGAAKDGWDNWGNEAQ